MSAAAPPPPPSTAVVATSLVSNVEATLTFTLASKLVEMMLALQQQPVPSDKLAWLLGAMCLMILSISTSWNRGSAGHSASSAVGRDLLSMLNQTLVLAFSRIVLLQIRLSTANASSPLFEYLRRFLEITFTVVVLYSVVKVIPELGSSPKAPSPDDVGSVASRQLSTLMINMQRTFAETVASIIVDQEIRKLVVLWGVCMLPSISRILGRFKSSSYFSATKPKAGSKQELEEEEEALLWMAGLGTAWMNTAIGFVLPNSPSARSSAAVLWMQVTSTLCLAIASRAVQPMLPGIEMFQGFIEWTIATGSSAALVAATGVSKMQLVVATGAIFWILDAIKDAAQAQQSFFWLSSITLHGIAAVMFTNSVVAWVMDAISSANASASASPTASNIGFTVVSIASGVILAKVLLSLLNLKEQATST